MGFFKMKPKERHVKVVVAGPYKVGKTVCMIDLGKSPIFGPVAIVDTQQGAQFYKHLLHPGSEIVPADTPEEVHSAVEQMVHAGSSFPFKTVVIDDITTYWAKMVGMYDEYKALRNAKYKDAAAVQKMFDEKMKNIADWGKIKGQYHKVVRKLFDLPVHIFFTTWIASIFKKDEKTGQLVPVEGEFTAKLESATNYMVDAAYQVQNGDGWPKKLKIQYARTRIIKDGDPLSVETFEKMANALKDEPVPESNAPEVSKTLEAPEAPAQTSDQSLTCSKCGTTIPKTIAVATSKQNGGKPLCLNCLKTK